MNKNSRDGNKLIFDLQCNISSDEQEKHNEHNSTSNKLQQLKNYKSPHKTSHRNTHRVQQKNENMSSQTQKQLTHSDSPTKLLVYDQQDETQSRSIINVPPNEKKKVNNKRSRKTNNYIIGQNSQVKTEKNKEDSQPIQLKLKLQQAKQQQQISNIGSMIDSVVGSKMQLDQKSSQNDYEIANQAISVEDSGKQNSQLSQIWSSKSVNSIYNLNYSTKIANLQDPQQIRLFLMSPLEQGKIIEFEVHKFSKFMKTQYFLCIQYGELLKYIACSIKVPSISTTHIHTIYVKVQNTLLGESDDNKFVGMLVGNFQKQNHTLYDHKNYESPAQNNKIICTIVTMPNYTNEKLRKQQLYIPKVQDNENTVIYNNTLSNNLKKLLKTHQLQNQISKFTSHLISRQKLKRLQQQFKVVTNTTRNAEVKDESKNTKFVIIKMQNNRFKIRACSGLSPIHIFSYAIVHLQ